MTALKADQIAAERLLKKAVKRAAEIMAGTVEIDEYRGSRWLNYDAPHVVAMLTAAGTSAALLLGEDAS